MYKIYYRTFALEYLPKFISALMNYFLNAPPNLIRQFKKDILDDILEYLDKLMKRCYSLGEKYKMIEYFALNMAGLMMNCDFLEQQI